MLHRVTLLRPDGETSMPPDELLEGRINGAIEGFSNRLDGVAEFVRKLQKDVEALQLSAAERMLIIARLETLEKGIDNLPARVDNLEKYGSDVTIHIPEMMKEQNERIGRLEKRPKKKRKQEAQRQARALVWAGVISAGAVVLSLGCSAIGLGVSIWLSHH